LSPGFRCQESQASLRYLNSEEQVFEAEDWLEINEDICIEFQAGFEFPTLELDRPKVRVSRLMRAQGEDVGKLFELETKVGDEYARKTHTSFC
jgi:hypothetical protein